MPAPQRSPTHARAHGVDLRVGRERRCRRAARRSCAGSATGAGGDAGEGADEHRQVAGAGLGRHHRGEAADDAATAAGRVVMVGTSSTRNTSGTAKSSGT